MPRAIELPTHSHPDTKDKWLYIAGPVAIKKLIELRLGSPDLAQQPFSALGVSAIQNLSLRGILDDLMEAGDIVLLRMEATDG